MSSNTYSIPPYYDTKSWPLTNQDIDDYSKIYDVNHIFCCKQDIKYNDKLLVMDFNVLRTDRSTGGKYIAHRLYIIRTVKEGEIFCKNPSYIYVESREDTSGIIAKRINSHSHILVNNKIINHPLYEMFIYFPPFGQKSVIYTVKLLGDDLLNDIKAKKRKHIPSLVQLCVSAIATNDLDQYNDMNRTMHLALK